MLSLIVCSVIGPSRLKKFLVGSLAIYACYLGTAAPGSAADVRADWQGTNGLWSDSAQWSSGEFPINGQEGPTYDVGIARGLIELDQDIEIDTLEFSGGQLTGSGNLTLHNSLDWQRGDFAGTGQVTIASATLTGGVTKRLEQPMTANGLIDWQSGLWSWAVQRGSLQLQADAELAIGGDGSKVMQVDLRTEAGSRLRHSAPGTTRLRDVNAVWEHHGDAQIEAGTLAVYYQVTGDGSIQVHDGATLDLRAGSQIYSGPLSGEGTLRVAGANAAWTGDSFDIDNMAVESGLLSLSSTDSALASFSLSGGSVFAHNLLQAESFRWSGGNLLGAGGVSLAQGMIDGNVAKNVDSTLAVNGLLEWQQGDITWQNVPGLLEIGAGGELRISGDQSREGLVNIRVQEGGLLTFANQETTGLAKAGTSVRNEGGTLAGTGDISISTGALQNLDGTLEPGDGGVGALELAGDYLQAAEGILDVELGGTDVGFFDQLIVTGTANLDGQLRVSLLNDFVPKMGDRFEILPAGAVLGEFASLDLPVGLPWSVEYGDGVTLSITNPNAGGGLPGDFNDNGTVEQADLDLVLLHWGDNVSVPPETWTNDLPSGIIDQEELDRVLLHWGNSAIVRTGAGVPEPRSLSLVVITLGLWAASRRMNAKD